MRRLADTTDISQQAGNVTAQVQAWVNAPPGNYGLALTSGAANVLFDSKENDETGHAARLDITLVNQGPEGIQGIPGGAGAVGATGAAGPIGPVGPQGIPGVSGAVGPQGAIGPAGVAGTQGAIGPAGPTGPQGVIGTVGATGPQGPSATFRGAWLAGSTYDLGDAVFYNGSSYVSLIGNNAAHQPDISIPQWSLLAEQGATGATGSVGAIGPQGPSGIPGATGPQGPLGSVDPQGATGSTGSTGLVGPAGPTGAIGAVGPVGVTGPQGPPVSFLGVWNVATTYALGDAVSFNGSSYISLVADNLGFQPNISNVKWALLAQAGAAGAAGTTGSAGPTGPSGPVGPSGPAGASGGGVNSIVYTTEFINPGTGAGTTFYLSPLSHTSSLIAASNGAIASGTEANFSASPVACTMNALNVGVDNYSTSAADTTTITIYKNLVATSMTCSAATSGSSSSCKDISHTFSVASGDSISIAFVETNATPFNKVTIELVCQ